MDGMANNQIHQSCPTLCVVNLDMFYELALDETALKGKVVLCKVGHLAHVH